MNPNRAISHDRFAQEFHDYGLAGIELHRAEERRADERYRHDIAALAPAHGLVAAIRRSIGDLLIAAGREVAGVKAASTGQPFITTDLPW